MGVGLMIAAMKTGETGLLSEKILRIKEIITYKNDRKAEYLKECANIQQSHPKEESFIILNYVYNK